MSSGSIEIMVMGVLSTLGILDTSPLIYEGRSINKLQNSVILLVFQIKKIWNIHFVGNLILSTNYEFHYDDVTVTSFINIKYSDVAVEVVP